MKQCNRMRSLALLLLLSTIVSMFPILTSEDEKHIHTAEAASTCPFDGDTEVIAYLGCSVCGGSGSISAEQYRISGLPSKGTGVYGSSTETDAYGNIWTIYYRCYNCGVCAKNSVVAYKTMTKGVQQDAPVGQTITVSGKGPGVVPKRWCSICGRTLQKLGQDYVDREASYGVYHIDPDKLTKTYTVDVVCNPSEGGSAGDGGEYEEGEVMNLWATANSGYAFSGWSGGTVTNGKYTVTKDVVLTANFVKVAPTVNPNPSIPIPTIPPTPIPKPTTKVPTPIPTSEPTSIPTPLPTPTYTPKTDKITYRNIERYYTTDRGYTMNQIYASTNTICNLDSVDGGGGITANDHTKLNYSYKTGTDEDGNIWYFIPDETSATYVHPAVYEGNSVNTEAVRNITELVFPESIIFGGTEYTVTSIGGGTSKYKSGAGSSGSTPPYISTSYDITDSSYSYYNDSSTSACVQTHTYDIRSAYGVVGTGYIESVALRDFYYLNDDALELKANDKEKYKFYHNVKCTLKAYMNEKSDTRFKKFFKKYECSNPSIPTGRGD